MKIGHKIMDFLNNRIINVKTNTPTDKDHVVPKNYVDTSVTYKTVKSEKYKNPFKFFWMKDSTNKPVVTILDDLLYPDINPEYVEPSTMYSLTQDNNKNIINRLESTEFTVDYKIIKNDRDLDSPVEIVLVTKNGEVTYPDTKINYTNVMKFKCVLNDVTDVLLRFKYTTNNNTKETTYGTDYVAPEFKLKKTVDVSLLESITKNKHVTNSLMVISDTVAVTTPIFNGIKATQTIDELKGLGFQPTLSIINHKAPKTDSYHYNNILMLVDNDMFLSGTIRFNDNGTWFDLPLGGLSVDKKPTKINGVDYYVVMYKYMSKTNLTNINIYKYE